MKKKPQKQRPDPTTAPPPPNLRPQNPELDAPKAIADSGQQLPETPAAGQGRPRAPFVSNLTVSREIEDMIDDRATRWRDNLRNTTGWTETADEHHFVYTGLQSDPFQLSLDLRRHFVKRALYQAMADDKWEWRRWAYGPNTIFAKSNLSAPIARRIAKQMTGKANNAFFGTKPYFSTWAVGKSDGAFAEQLQKVGEGKMEKSGSTGVMREAVRRGFDLGEAVIRTGFTKDASFYRKLDVVLAGPDGKPLLDTKGKYITTKAAWTMGVGPDGRPVQVLTSDGVTVMPRKAKWLTGKFPLSVVHYSGPKMVLCGPRDILADPSAPSLDAAPCVVYTYTTTAVELAAMFTDSASGTQIVQAVELMREISGVDPVSSTDPRVPNAEASNSEIIVEEFHMRLDADQDKITENLVYIRAGVRGGAMLPLFYDYLENFTSTKRRPFSVIRPLARPESWTGIGALEMFEHHQKIVDLLLNRWSYATSTSGRITCWDPDMFVETAGPKASDLTLNDGKYYRFKSGLTAEQKAGAIIHFPIPDNIGEKWREIMEFYLQLAITESGTNSANDSQVAGLDSQKTATGINSNDRAGEILFSVHISSLTDGLERCIRDFVQTLYATITTDEVFEVTEGKVAKKWTVTPREVEGLEFDVSIMLARFRSAALRDALTVAIPQCMQFYALPLPTQAKLAPLFVQYLKSLEIPDADEIITAPNLMGLDPDMLMQAQAALQSPNFPPELLAIFQPLVDNAIAMAQASAPEQNTGGAPAAAPATTGQEPPLRNAA